MDQPNPRSYTERLLSLTWEFIRREHMGMEYDERIGWYNSETLKSEERLLVKREEPYDLPTI